MNVRSMLNQINQNLETTFEDWNGNQELLQDWITALEHQIQTPSLGMESVVKGDNAILRFAISIYRNLLKHANPQEQLYFDTTMFRNIQPHRIKPVNSLLYTDPAIIQQYIDGFTIFLDPKGTRQKELRSQLQETMKKLETMRQDTKDLYLSSTIGLLITNTMFPTIIGTILMMYSFIALASAVSLNIDTLEEEARMLLFDSVESIVLLFVDMAMMNPKSLAKTSDGRISGTALEKVYNRFQKIYTQCVNPDSLVKHTVAPDDKYQMCLLLGEHIQEIEELSKSFSKRNLRLLKRFEPNYNKMAYADEDMLIKLQWITNCVIELEKILMRQAKTSKLILKDLREM